MSRVGRRGGLWPLLVETTGGGRRSCGRRAGKQLRPPILTRYRGWGSGSCGWCLRRTVLLAAAGAAAVVFTADGGPRCGRGICKGRGGLGGLQLLVVMAAAGGGRGYCRRS